MVNFIFRNNYSVVLLDLYLEFVHLADGLRQFVERFIFVHIHRDVEIAGGNVGKRDVHIVPSRQFFHDLVDGAVFKYPAVVVPGGAFGDIGGGYLHLFSLSGADDTHVSRGQLLAYSLWSPQFGFAVH